MCTYVLVRMNCWSTMRTIRERHEHTHKNRLPINYHPHYSVIPTITIMFGSECLLWKSHIFISGIELPARTIAFHYFAVPYPCTGTQFHTYLQNCVRDCVGGKFRHLQRVVLWWNLSLEWWRLLWCECCWWCSTWFVCSFVYKLSPDTHTKKWKNFENCMIIPGNDFQFKAIVLDYVVFHSLYAL